MALGVFFSMRRRGCNGSLLLSYLQCGTAHVGTLAHAQHEHRQDRSRKSKRSDVDLRRIIVLDSMMSGVQL